MPRLRVLRFPKWILISRGHDVIELHLHNNTMVNQRSSLQGREKNSDSVNQDSNKPASEKLMQGLKGSDTVGVREKSSKLLRVTVASSMFKSDSNLQLGNHCLLERLRSCFNTFRDTIQSSGRSIQIFTKREIPMKDRVWTTIRGFLRNDRHHPETRISKEVMHMIRHRDQR